MARKPKDSPAAGTGGPIPNTHPAPEQGPETQSYTGVTMEDEKPVQDYSYFQQEAVDMGWDDFNPEAGQRVQTSWQCYYVLEALDFLRKPVDLKKGIEAVYVEFEAHAQNVYGLLVHYNRRADDHKQDEKLLRAQLDGEWSEAVDPAKNKSYTRGAIEAKIESDPKVQTVMSQRIGAEQIVRLLTHATRLLEYRFQHIVNFDVNTRRAMRGETI